MLPEIEKDRQAFLNVVKRYAGATVRDSFALIVDDLIAWSRNQHGRIEFRARNGKQATVTFCRAGTPHIVWQVYPRVRDGAKLIALPPCAWVRDPVRRSLLKKFAELTDRGQPDCEVIPTLSFSALERENARKQLKSWLSESLAALG